MSLVPAWGGMDIDREVPLFQLPMGVATMAAGFFDHLLLVRTFGRPNDLTVGGNEA